MHPGTIDTCFNESYCGLMDARRSSSPVVTTLACILVVCASGDDFNLLRIALPCAFVDAAKGMSPLDDESEDFLRSADESPNTFITTLGGACEDMCIEGAGLAVFEFGFPISAFFPQAEHTSWNWQSCATVALRC
jgi:hypothetical protein